MIAISKQSISYVPPYATKAISTVSSFAINFFSSLATLASHTFKTIYNIPLHSPLDWASCLWSWRSQAIYLRGKLVYETVYNFFTQAELKKVIADQKTTISTLQDNLAQANQTIATLQQEHIEKEALAKQLTTEKKDLEKALQDEQLSTYRITIQKEISEQEQAFIALITSIYTDYKALTNTPSSHRHLIDSLIPSWQKHLEAHCEIMAQAIASTPEDVIHKKLMIKLHELTKRPLVFTEFLAKFCLVLTPQPLTISTDELGTSASQDPEEQAFIAAMACLEQELLRT